MSTPDQPAPESLRHPLTQALLLLTFTTGIVDAVSFLGIGRVFTANMTGNVVLLGLGLAGGAHLPVLAQSVSLAGFLVGAGCGGLLTARVGSRQRTHIGAALAIEIVLIVLATALAAIVSVRAGAASGVAVIAMLALAMGLRNATMRHVGVTDLTTTVLTGTLTNLATGLPVFGGSGKATARRVTTVIAMLLGALVGALLLKISLVLPMAVAAGLAAASWAAFVR
ncbi:MAG: YoaK family protein [Solirubrobacteraceae bacterium]